MKTIGLLLPKLSDRRYLNKGPAVCKMGHMEFKRARSDEHIDALAKKYLGVERYPFRRAGQQRIILKIEPEAKKISLSLRPAPNAVPPEPEEDEGDEPAPPPKPPRKVPLKGGLGDRDTFGT